MTATTANNEVPNLTAVLGNESECAAKLRSMFADADVHPNFPATTATVCEVLRQGGGFDVSVELLEDWARRGMVPDVRLRTGRYSWTPLNMLTAAIQADVWRRWVPLSPKHIHKLTAVELEEARANAAGETAFTDLDQFDMCAFVEILSRCDDRNMRETFAVALKTKLRNLGVLDK